MTEVNTPAATALPKIYNLTGEVVSFWEVPRKNGNSIGTVDLYVKVKTTIKKVLREITVSIAAGKPLNELRSKVTAGATLMVYGKYEQVAPNGDYAKGGQTFKAFGASKPRVAATA